MKKKIYSLWFVVPTLTVFTIIFLLPMIASLYYSMTVWSFDGYEFCGIDNYILFLKDQSLRIGIKNTFIYAILTCSLKLIFSFLIALLLTSKIRTRTIQRSMVFFPHLVSAMAIGITFQALMHDTKGVINQFLGFFGIPAVNWLTNPDLALYSVILVDVWKGLSIATIIFMAGIQSIDTTYFEAARVDGASYWQQIKNITIPLARPAMNSIITLAFIGGLRNFEMIWVMTGGGPGFASDVMASIIYKQYAAGYYGLSTAGTVILFVMIAILVFPLRKYLLSKEID